MVLFQLEPGSGKPEREFRFDVMQAQALEERAGCAPWMLSLRGQSVKALVLMLTYALRHSDDKLTESKAAKLIQRFLDKGGKVKALSEALTKALKDSGVYGAPDEPADADDATDEKDEKDEEGVDDDAHPPTATE